MCFLQKILFIAIFQQILTIEQKFPDNFLFGVSSAAYQIEGGYDTRGETVFDHYQKLDPSLVLDQSDAKIACDSYHRYQDDLTLLQNLGVDFYRFSIAWSRILPTGYSNKINPAGIRYYSNLIDGLIKRKIQPMVTMFHYDLPKPLQDLGGWTNPLLADLFEDYSKILFANFGSRVKFWITFNANFWGCGDAQWPPKLDQSGIGEYLCAKTVLLAHAKAYWLYQKEFRAQRGSIGLTIDGRWYEPGGAQEHEAADRTRDFLLGLFANPLFGNGDFPDSVKKRVDFLSQNEGFLKSRLPKFSPDESKLIKGTADFLGLNIYTSYLVKNDPDLDALDSFSMEKDIGVQMYQDPKWEGALSNWLKVVPWGLRNVLKWFKTKYGNPKIFITENGFSDNGTLEDFGRINFYKLYLTALLDSIYIDGVNVQGYSAWSLLDNFEWLSGYTEKFGLIHVNFTDPDRKRTPKRSANWYKNLLKNRGFDEPKSEL